MKSGHSEKENEGKIERETDNEITSN